MYKLIIWSADPAAEDPAVPSFTGYTVTSTGWEKKAPEEIPAELYLTVPDICASCTLTVEDPSAVVRKRLTDFAVKTTCRVCGVLLASDGGEEPVPVLQTSNARNIWPRVSEYSPRVTLALWFPGGAAVRSLREPLLQILQKQLPFALPARYGEQNPPEYALADAGLPAAAAFLQHCDRPVWFPSTPVCNVFLRDNAQGEEGKCGYFSLTVPESLYDGYPAWREALSRLLCSLCALYGAFFGQIVRGVPGVAGGQWMGIPENLGEVCRFGGPYRGISKPPKEYISYSKKTLFGRRKGEGRGYALPGDFLPAANVPPECVNVR